MKEYALAVFGICAIIGALSLLTYGSGRTESLSIGIICLFIRASPIAEVSLRVDTDGWLGSVSIPDGEISSGYDEVVEDAFADGIKRAIADKFSLNKDDIRVRLTNFDSKNMFAEKIRVVLSGRAALADYVAVEKYLNGLSMGECSVEIEIG